MSVRCDAGREGVRAMRHYEIRHVEDAGFESWVRAIPVEPTRWGWMESVVFTQLTEPDAHRAAVFMRTHEDVPLGELYHLTCKELGL